MSARDPRATDRLAEWSAWQPLDAAADSAPLLPGVYMARESREGPVVYVGMAGERRGKGIRGRLAVYRSGKALASGLGEAAMDRALADPEWLRNRLREVERGHPRRATSWGRAAMARADLHVRWSVTTDRAGAAALEQAVLAVFGEDDLLWNRRR